MGFNSGFKGLISNFSRVRFDCRLYGAKNVRS